MKSKQRKWEQLLSDIALNDRLHSHVKMRENREFIQNRRILGTTIFALVFFGIIGFSSGIVVGDDLETDVSLVIQEFDSNIFLNIGED